jgi:hypothetical protein
LIAEINLGLSLLFMEESYITQGWEVRIELT